MKHFTEIYLRAEIEIIIGETLQAQSVKLNEDLLSDFVAIFKYSMKLVLTEDPSFANKMKFTDTFFISVTDSVV